MKEKFEKIVKFSPAFDKRSDEPKKNYGIGAMSIWFVLKGAKGAVQVMFGTDWYLPETIKEYEMFGNENKKPPIYLREDRKFLRCWDVGYHSPKPMYNGQKKMDCEILGKCYYDGTSLRGEDDDIVEKFLKEGSDFIWKYLEKEYDIIFGAKDEI